jgi:hypothetical protein
MPWMKGDPQDWIGGAGISGNSNRDPTAEVQP